MNSPFKDQVGGGRGQCFRYSFIYSFIYSFTPFFLFSLFFIHLFIYLFIIFRYEKWGYCKYTHADRAIPCMLGEDDTKDFNDTECLFARKFVHGHLPTLISSFLKIF